MKKFKSAMSHDGQRCDVVFVEADTFSGIPSELALKAHAVCFWNKKMLLVNHPEWNIWSIPGGTREDGETIEQTMIREVREETNCNVLEYRPISYQKVTSPSGRVHYRLHYICEVEPLGDFSSDPAGGIDKILWIDPHEYEKYIEEKEMRRIVLRRALSVYQDEV